MTAFLGVDLGTTAVKAAAITPDGRCRGQARAPLSTRRDGARAEQHPDDWWQATLDVIRSVARSAGGEVAGVAVGGHGPSPAFVDAAGAPVGPCPIWMDRRAAGEHAALSARLGSVAPAERLAVTSAAQARWLRAAAPERFARVEHLLHSWDVVSGRLTGRLTRSEALPARVHEAAELPAAWRRTPVVPGGAVIGVSPAAAAATGLAAGTPVVAGGLDSWLAIVGSGVRRAGDTCLVGGTSSIVARALPAGHSGRFSVFGQPVESRAESVGGQALDWIGGLVEPGVAVEAVVDRAMAARADGRGFVPYLHGRRWPTPDPGARGLFFGLDGTEGGPQMVRAVLEGLALVHRALLRGPWPGSPPDGPIRFVGGQAGHPALVQLRADALDAVMLRPRYVDAGPVGAAMLAAAAVAGLDGAATAAMNPVVERYAPRPDQARVFDRAAALQARVAEAMDPLSPLLEPAVDPCAVDNPEITSPRFEAP